MGPQTGFTSRSLSPAEQDHVQHKQDRSEMAFTGIPEGNHLNTKEKMETALTGMCKLVAGSTEEQPVASPMALPQSRDDFIFVAKKKKAIFLPHSNLNVLSHKVQETPVKPLLAAPCHSHPAARILLCLIWGQPARNTGYPRLMDRQQTVKSHSSVSLGNRTKRTKIYGKLFWGRNTVTADLHSSPAVFDVRAALCQHWSPSISWAGAERLQGRAVQDRCLKESCAV